MIYDLEPTAYELGIKPHEFWNSTYREMLLYVESFSLSETQKYKNQIRLVEDLGNKLISSGMTAKKPKNINLIREIYSDLFKKELEMQDIYNKKASEGEELINLMYELSEELKSGGDKE